jgi:hypothetical protein
LDNIEEIASDDERMQGIYVPRKSNKNQMFIHEELNLREEGLARDTERVNPMDPESEGNYSYFRENSSYYANSPNRMSNGSYQNKK